VPERFSVDKRELKTIAIATPAVVATGIVALAYFGAKATVEAANTAVSRLYDGAEKAHAMTDVSSEDDASSDPILVDNEVIDISQFGDTKPVFPDREPMPARPHPIDEFPSTNFRLPGDKS